MAYDMEMNGKRNTPPPTLTKLCPICSLEITFKPCAAQSAEERAQKIWKCPTVNCNNRGVVHKYCVDFKAKRDGYGGVTCDTCEEVYEIYAHTPRNCYKIFLYIILAGYVPLIIFNILYLWALAGTPNVLSTLTWIPRPRNVFISYIVSIISYTTFVLCLSPCWGLSKRLFNRAFSFARKPKGKMYRS